VQIFRICEGEKFGLVYWGQKTLALVDNCELKISAKRLEAKLGWLKEYRNDLREWSEMHAVIGTTLDFVRYHGLYVGAGLDLTTALPARTGRAGELRAELIDFVTRESSKARVGERLPGITEVLESSFGRLKRMESDQAKSGFTGMVLRSCAEISARNWHCGRGRYDVRHFAWSILCSSNGFARSTSFLARR
jgi:hypothetical protein